MVSSASPPSSAIDPPDGTSNPAISRSKEVLPDPLGPVTASTSPDAAANSRWENTSRPPRTHLTSRPESRILPRLEPSESQGSPQRNLWVPQGCGTLVSVA